MQIFSRGGVSCASHSQLNEDLFLLHNVEAGSIVEAQGAGKTGLDPGSLLPGGAGITSKLHTSSLQASFFNKMRS